MTVCWSLLPGGVSAPRGGVCSPGGLVPGGLLRGVSAPRGCVLGGCVCSGGGCAPGVCVLWESVLRGGSAHGGVWSVGYIPACTEADPPVDRQTPVKILPWPNFVAAVKYSHQQYYYTGSPRMSGVQTLFSQGVTTVSWLLFMHWSILGKGQCRGVVTDHLCLPALCGE